MKMIEAISDILYGTLQQHERLDLIAKSIFLKGPLSLLVLAASVFFTGNLLVAALGMTLVWFLILTIVDIRNASSVLCRVTRYPHLSGPTIWPRFHLSLLAKLAWLSAPLGLVMMLMSLNHNIPRYFIAHQFGQADLGVFAALAYILTASMMAVNTLGQAASARLARSIADKNRPATISLIGKLLLVGAVVSTIGIAVAIFAGETLLALIYRPEYAAHADVLVAIMVAAAISNLASLLGYCMTAARAFRIQLPLFIAVGVTTAVATPLLLPVYGLRGAAWGMSAGFAVQLAGSAIVVVRILKQLKSTPLKDQL